MHFHSIFLLPSPGRNLHVDAILLHDHRKHENYETGNCENLHHVGIWKDMVVREVPYWTWLGNAHWSCLRPWPVPERHRSLTKSLVTSFTRVVGNTSQRTHSWNPPPSRRPHKGGNSPREGKSAGLTSVQIYSIQTMMSN